MDYKTELDAKNLAWYLGVTISYIDGKLWLAGMSWCPKCFDGYAEMLVYLQARVERTQGREENPCRATG